jgi:hypothetical protein
VLLVGWVRDAVFGSFEYGPEWQEMLDQIPEPLKALPFDPDTTTGFRTGGKPDLPFVSCVMWRLPEDDAWQIPRFTHPREVVDDMRNYAEDMTADEWRDDDAAHLLVDLILRSSNGLSGRTGFGTRGCAGSTPGMSSGRTPA